MAPFLKMVEHGAPTGVWNSSLGHPNMAEATVSKNFPTVIPPLLHIFSGWFLQGLLIWCVSLSRPQNCWCKRWHITRRGGDVSSKDAQISTRGCPNLQHLDKPGCPRLRKDARIWIKMAESRLELELEVTDLISLLFFFCDGEAYYMWKESSAQWYL